MKTWLRYLVAIFVSAIVISAAFYYGGVIGFRQGYIRGAWPPSEARMTVNVLRNLRRGDTESAIKILESQLDMQIVWHGLVIKSGKSLFDVGGVSKPKYNTAFMGPVANYRDQYSSQAPNSETRKAISSILKRYSSGINYTEGMFDVR